MNQQQGSDVTSLHTPQHVLTTCCVLHSPPDRDEFFREIGEFLIMKLEGTVSAELDAGFYSVINTALTHLRLTLPRLYGRIATMNDMITTACVSD